MMRGKATIRTKLEDGTEKKTEGRCGRLMQDFGIRIRAAYRAVKITPPFIWGGPSVLVPPSTDECEDEAPERPHVCPECNGAFETLRQLVAHQTHKHGYRHPPGIVRTEFPLTREMQNCALTQAPGTPEARPQRPKRPRDAQRAAEPRHTEANAANSVPSGLETQSGDPRAAGGHLPHDACEVRRTFGAGEQSGHGTLRDQIERGTAANVRAAQLRTGGHNDGFETSSTLLRNKQKSGGIHVQRKFTGDSPAEHLLEPVQKNSSEGLGQVAVFRGPPDSPSCASSSKP